MESANLVLLVGSPIGSGEIVHRCNHPKMGIIKDVGIKPRRVGSIQQKKHHSSSWPTTTRSAVSGPFPKPTRTHQTSSRQPHILQATASVVVHDVNQIHIEFQNAMCISECGIRIGSYNRNSRRCWLPLLQTTVAEERWGEHTSERGSLRSDVTELAVDFRGTRGYV